METDGEASNIGGPASAVNSQWSAPSLTGPPFARHASAPTGQATSSSRVVVVQSGARDAYQVARALAETGQLETLVTDLYWPADRPWARALGNLLPSRLRALLLQRTEPRLPSQRVHTLWVRGLLTLLVDKLPRAPFRWRRSLMRATDARLGAVAGKLARTTGAGLLSYSYYGYDAFRAYGRPGVLFQLHPHPASMRRILRAELDAHPDCAESLRKEWELSLPEADYQHLVAETRMAKSFLVASTFTRKTLEEHGARSEAIRVIPYGVDCQRFSPDQTRTSGGRRLELLFVGRINQRKGIKYLLEALRLLRSEHVHLTVCGRVVDSLDLFRPFGDQVTLRPDVSPAELCAAYRAADLFVFPSVAEGFGQVLLESLASGLPILSTTHTAAPDLITEGVEGFVVEPRRPDLLARHIDWAATHPEALRPMRARARQRAEQFTWASFRSGVARATRELLDQPGQEEAQVLEQEAAARQRERAYV